MNTVYFTKVPSLRQNICKSLTPDQLFLTTTAASLFGNVWSTGLQLCGSLEEVNFKSGKYNTDRHLHSAEIWRSGGKRLTE
ncbi:hypothetical protein RRG08_014098 [Elysia crispata]|uniref:Uncharacterized protein n=1 Tax=Elysia crispata TaxID=231223 RepID=A0AAE0XQM1_9GAST|nr:hypothetical protein RRG08_014098 [Elysia crispata]